MAANTIPRPDRVRRDAWLAYRAAGDRTAFAQVYVDAIGTAPRLRIIRRVGQTETTVLELRLPDTRLIVADGDIVVPTNYAEVVTCLTTVFDGSAAFLLRVGKADNSVYLEAPISKSGSAFIVSADMIGASPVSAASVIGLGSVRFGAPRPAGGTTTGALPTALELVFFGDSRMHGSENEVAYPSCRGYVQQTLRAAGINVTVLGLAGNDNPVRLGSSFSAKSAAHGGWTLEQINAEVNNFAAQNQRTSYRGVVCIIGGGANNAFKTPADSEAQIRGYWQTLITNAQAKLPGAVFLTLGLEPGNGAFQQSLSNATATYLAGLDTGDASPVWNLNLNASASWPAGMFNGDVHFNEAGAIQEAGLIAGVILTRARSSTVIKEPSNNSAVMAELQRTGHEVYPFHATPNIQYALAPYVITNQTIGVGNFNLLGSSLMPSWFDPANKASISGVYWTTHNPWWVVASIRQSREVNTNTNTDPNAAVRIGRQRFFVRRGRGVWDQYSSSTAWVGSYLNDFTTGAAGATWRQDGTDYIVRPSLDGRYVPHGGCATVNISSATASSVDGLLFVAYANLCHFTTGVPYASATANLTMYGGDDPLPPGGSANGPLLGYNYAPGPRCGPFLRMTSAVRPVVMTTLTAAQLAADPVIAGLL